APEPPDLPGGHGPHGPECHETHHQRALFERIEPAEPARQRPAPEDRRPQAGAHDRHAAIRSSSGTSRTTRAGTPITTARGGTSRVTTAPDATKASSPISTPGVSTTPPPTRQARRSSGPDSSKSPPWRAIVSSLVVTTPGPTNASSSITVLVVM